VAVRFSGYVKASPPSNTLPREGKTVVAAPLMGVSSDGPGYHASGAADKSTPASRGAIRTKHRKENERAAFMAPQVSGLPIVELTAPILSSARQHL